MEAAAFAAGARSTGGGLLPSPQCSWDTGTLGWGEEQKGKVQFIHAHVVAVRFGLVPGLVS